MISRSLQEFLGLRGVKKCPRCGQIKELGAFSNATVDGRRKYGYCRPCNSSYQRVLYRRNGGCGKGRERRALRSAFIDAALAVGCVDCGTKEQVVLDLDHIRGKKTASVSTLRSASLSRLFAEIDKCEVRCANCHRRITAERRAA